MLFLDNNFYYPKEVIELIACYFLLNVVNGHGHSAGLIGLVHLLFSFECCVVVFLAVSLLSRVFGIVLLLFICSPLLGYHGVYNLCSCWRA